ncbi:MAG: adenosylcobinamide-phosphate synthase CbiB [Thermacetogeniaceae bacterium]
MGLADACHSKMAILFLALLLDLLVGDPHVPYHPVALLGRAIAWWEKVFYRENSSPWRQRLSGIAFTAVNVVLVGAGVWFGLRLLRGYRLVWLVASALLLWCTVAGRSLYQAGMRIYRLLEEGDLDSARKSVGMIVGRDTESLDEAEIARATVETIAENLSDGIIAPLFWFLVGGVPLACAYRAINTLDSMVGYRNERYLWFGWFSARLDDLVNYIPARLTALLLVVSALLSGYRWRDAFRIALRDARKHPSPNSGYPEAAMAGALGIRLGGVNRYGGVESFRPYLGDSHNPLDRSCIGAALELMQLSVICFLVLVVGCWFLWNRFFGGVAAA